MSGIRIIISHNIIILPKNWYFCNSLEANQTLFQIQFSKNHPRRDLKNNAENGFGLHRQLRWRAEPLQTSFSNSVRALFRICSQEEFSGFSAAMRQLVPKVRLAFLLVKWWFSVARQRLQNKFCRSNFSGVAGATQNSQFNPMLTKAKGA